MRSSLLIILAFIYSLPVLAQSKGEGAGFASQWGASNLKITGGKDTSDNNRACKGTSAEAGLTQISSNPTRAEMRQDLRNYYLDYNALYYVAREINQNGAKFCKTIVTGKRGGCNANTHTTYFEPTGDADCFWLCKHGYFGDGCSARVAYGTSPKLTTQQFGAKKTKSGVVAMAANKKKDNTNIEDNIPMFQYGKYIKCFNANTETERYIDLKNWAHKNKQEHDIVLALKTVIETSTTITGTTVPALKMQVQPLVVRAGSTVMCAEKGNDRAMAMVEFAGVATNVCPSDYDNYCASTNSAGICTNLLCVDPTAKSKVEQEKKQQQTENRLKNMCAGYTRDSYKPGVHELYYVNRTSLEEIDPQPDENATVNWGDVCVKYKCTASKAFKADWQTSGDMGCYECTGEVMRFGVDNQGVCQQCVKGEIFDSNTKKCETAKVFSKNDMRFGVGNAPSADLEKQCWIKDNPDCYKCCMMGESGAPAACQQCKELTAETPESESSE